MFVLSDKVRQQIREALASEDAKGADYHTDTVEAILRRSVSDDGVRQSLQAALKAKYTNPPDGGYVYPWVRDVFHSTDTTGTVVWEVSGSCYQASYTLTLDTGGDYTAELGAEAEVDVAYVPMTDAREGAGAVLLSNEYSELVEGAVKPDGTTRIKIIKPGPGSSAYYPAGVLETEGPLTFRKGLHMFWNHPTTDEAKKRPERDLRDLAAKLTEDAKWDPKGPKGPGLYARAEVYPHYRKFVDSMAGDIGVSIRGIGITEDGEQDGYKGKILRHFGPMHSVDFVTAAGAGGEILGLFESARLEAFDPEHLAPKEEAPVGEGSTHMPLSAEERASLIKELSEAMAPIITQSQTAATEALAAITEANRRNEARAIATAVVRSIPGTSVWPEEARARIVESVAPGVPVKDGAIDREAYTVAIKEAVKAEAQYIATLRGGNVGVFGMGGNDDILTEADPFGEITGDPAKYKDALGGVFGAMGMSEAAVAVAVRGHVV